jgi:hypothetical protein
MLAEARARPQRSARPAQANRVQASGRTPADVHWRRPGCCLGGTAVAPLRRHRASRQLLGQQSAIERAHATRRDRDAAGGPPEGAPHARGAGRPAGGRARRLPRLAAAYPPALGAIATASPGSKRGARPRPWPGLAGRPETCRTDAAAGGPASGAAAVRPPP